MYVHLSSHRKTNIIFTSSSIICDQWPTSAPAVTLMHVVLSEAYY